MFKHSSVIIAILFAFILSTCGEASQGDKRSFSVLAINDVYRIAPMQDGEVGGFSRLKTIRDEMEKTDKDLLILHGGDFLSPSVLGQRFAGEQIIDIMNQINGDASTFDDRFFVVPGNHEFDVSGDVGAKWFRQRVTESNFWWVSSNINWADGSHPQIIDGLEQIIKHKIIDAGGIKVGIFGLTLNRDATKYAPIDSNYISIAKNMSQKLRAEGAEIVIGLTHLCADGPDIIFGGHEHEALKVEVDGRFVVKADSDLKSATIAHLSLDDGKLKVSLENKIIDNKIPEDMVVKAKVDEWLNRYYAEECGAEPGQKCNSTPFGHTNVELIAVEAEIRRFETNLGNWIADDMLYAFKHTGRAQVALINSGAIRKNENIAAGAVITNQLIKELLPYDPVMKLIEITGLELKNILTHSISNWQGNGYWLQVSGLAFRQNIETETVEDLMIFENGELRPVVDDEIIRAVTVNYLLDTNGPQDGYTMLSESNIIKTPHNGVNLQDFIREMLLETGDKGIAPIVEGRICNKMRPKPCLLDKE